MYGGFMEEIETHQKSTRIPQEITQKSTRNPLKKTHQNQPETPEKSTGNHFEIHKNSTKNQPEINHYLWRSLADGSTMLESTFKYAERAQPFKHTDGTGVSYYLRGLAVWPALHIFKCSYIYHKP